MLLVLPALCLGQGQIQFNNNAYSEVIVSISPDVPNANGQQVVDGIKVFAVATFFVVKLFIPTWRTISELDPAR